MTESWIFIVLSYDGTKADVQTWEIVVFSLGEGNFWKQRKWIAYSYICSYGVEVVPPRGDLIHYVCVIGFSKSMHYGIVKVDTGF